MKKKYTLIELLAAMTIFIIMMGILFKVFTAGADIASSQQTKVEIISDTNIFFTYMSDDMSNIDVDSIEHIRDNKDAENDPDAGATSNEHIGSKLRFASNYIGFLTDVTAYDEPTLINALDLDGDGRPDLKPYVIYEYLPTEKVILRKMVGADPVTISSSTLSAAGDDPIILEGVSAFEIKIWDDYPGGTEITTSPITTKPACVTISVTVTSPNPDAADELKDRQARTLSRTFYIDR